MISIKLLLYKLEYLGHELKLIKLFKGLHHSEEEFRQAINEAIVKCIVIESTLS